MSRDFLLLVFFMNQFPPSPQSIPLGPFRIFSKSRGDIRSSRLTTGVADTGGKWKKSSIRKILIILLEHLWIVELTYIEIFAFMFTLRFPQPDINLIVCHRCRWHRWQICHRYQQHYWNWGQNLPPVSLIPVANLPPVSLIIDLWIVELTYIEIFAFMFTLRYPQPDINLIVCHRYQQHYWNWGQNCRRCRWHRWSTFSCEYLREFSKKFETALMV